MSAKIGRNNLIDITGQKFGKLEVIKKVGSKKTPSGATKIFWYCKIYDIQIIIYTHIIF